MSTQQLGSLARVDGPKSSRVVRDPRPIGRILVDRGDLREADLARGLELQRRHDATIGDILVSEGWLKPDALRAAVAEQFGLTVVDLARHPPDDDLKSAIAPDVCVQNGVVPWRMTGEILFVATARPDKFEAWRAAAPVRNRIVVPVVADLDAIHAAQAALYGPALVWRAERRVMAHQSCRGFANKTLRRTTLTGLGIGTIVALCAVAPVTMWKIVSWTAILTMVLAVILKSSAALAELWAHARRKKRRDLVDITLMRQPKISVLVPLLREREIAHSLLRRLNRLTYPKTLLDVVLVLEARDHVTKDTLARADIPPWMRVIEVPEGSGLLTKPRALNYALDFCQGSIIGVWDAEDSPKRDQLEEVARQFHFADSNVACLQGRLDYYNPKDNWIARCFSIEYATWWRLVLPGLSRLGFVIPLGGTTLFFRRSVLDRLGAWDAHNVTEDADLGLRLARAGYRTQMIDTVTWEEANCRAWPWVRQRSRWLKGFALTWAVHMRAPRQLLRDLGLWRFLGVQAFYLSALAPFALAPVFWGFWLLYLAPQHVPDGFGLPQSMLALFIFCEVATLGLHLTAVRTRGRRHLMPWTPIMTVYFLLGTLAIYKAFCEIVTRPFFWDKTQHGVTRRSRRALS